LHEGVVTDVAGVAMFALILAFQKVTIAQVKSAAAREAAHP
jgi:hypothetical protein